MNITVGFTLDVDPNWLGGINYYRNLLTAVYADPARNIDAVVLTGTKANEQHFKGFPKVTIVRSPILDEGSAAHRLRRWIKRLSGKDLVLDRLIKKHRIVALSHSHILGNEVSVPVTSWIPDFQHIHLPHLFTAKECAERNQWFLKQCQANKLIILSSETARQDLLRMFPFADGMSEVLRFCPDVESSANTLDTTSLETRHGFSGPYFFLPNQYWAHKNHAVVIDALTLLKAQGLTVKVISTGGFGDYRNPEFYPNLRKKIDSAGLGSSYLALGVVPYQDMLALMKSSVAVINPSLFEGWSSTVEEAKALGKAVILSDIPVHREQNPDEAAFFAPNDAETLKDLMWSRWQQRDAHAVNGGDELTRERHLLRRRAFSKRFHEIVLRSTENRGGKAAHE